jgi:hypothetical protein
LKSISDTIVDISNDVSLVQMAKEVNMELDSFPDPRQEVKTYVSGVDHSQNISGGSANTDKLQTIKHVGNLAQKSAVNVVSTHGGDVISVEPSILIKENTAEDYLEMSSSLQGVAVYNESMETDDGGCMDEEGQ